MRQSNEISELDWAKIEQISGGSTNHSSVFCDVFYVRACFEAFRSTHKHCLIIDTDETPKGAALFRQDAVSLGGSKRTLWIPVSYKSSDCTDFPVEEGYEQTFLYHLIGHLRSHPDDFIIPNIHPRFLDRSGGSLWTQYLYSKTANPYYEDSLSRYEPIFKKKSVKRHLNWFLRNGSIDIKHKIGGATTKDLEEIFALHEERWALMDVSSKFRSNELQVLYRALFEAPNFYQQSRAAVLTTVHFDNSLLAAHLGFRWANTFLYHVPTINIEYLDKSPGEVLMWSLFEYARDNKLSVFDLGNGDESYKHRFSNKETTYETLLFSNSNSLKLIHAIRRFKIAKTILARIKTTTRGITARIRRAWRPVKIDFFRYSEMRQVQIAPDLEGRIREFSFREYVQFSRTLEIPPYDLDRRLYDRFRSGYRLRYLVANGKPVSFAWTNESTSTFVGEANTRVEATGGPIIWILDCFTPIKHRRKGYYSSLIREIAQQTSNKPVYIYAQSGNLPSIKGIQKAGFERISQLTRGALRASFASAAAELHIVRSQKG